MSKNGEILSTATTGGACYFFVGVEAAFEKIKTGLAQAAKSADVSPQNIDYICGGIAGANWPDEIEMLTKEVQTRFNLENITIVNDCVAALHGGTDNPNSIVLCAGSQFNCAIMVGGEIKHVLNNYVHPNDQGGEALGLRALQAIFDSHIGMRDKTTLTQKFMDHYGYDEIDRLLLGRDRQQLKTSPKDTVPILLEAAWQNDRVALDIIVEFSRSIAQYAVGSLKKYNLIGKDCDIVLSGGIFKSKHPLFFETISMEVHRISSHAKVVNAKYEPVVGAALLGLSKVNVSADAFKNCKQCAQALRLVREKGAPNA